MSGDKVELGFIENSDAWQLKSAFFPSKLGGKPAWLDLEELPSAEALKCGKCQNQLIFLCQIYAPCEENEENFVKNFHRTIFIFVCRNGQCCERNNSDHIKAFRSSLPRQNKFYPNTPPKLDPNYDISIAKFVNLCNVCGILSEKKCSQCKQVYYCCRQHQVLDWKEGHKMECNNSNVDRQPQLLFPQSEIIIETEELEDKTSNSEEELKKFQNLQLEGQTGTMSDASESDLDAHAESEKDKVFSKFKKRIDEYPEQIIRYKRGGTPLWIAKEPIPQSIPVCQYCGKERQFEFQIMPQVLTLLKENELDWGVIAVYTCKANCTTGANYKQEYVFKQDVEINSI